MRMILVALVVAACADDNFSTPMITQPFPDGCGAPDTGCVVCDEGIGDSCSPQCVAGVGVQPGDRCIIYPRGNPDSDTPFECTPSTVDGVRGCCLGYSFISLGEWNGDDRIGFFQCMD